MVGAVLGGIAANVVSGMLNNYFSRQQTWEDRNASYYLNEQSAENADRRARQQFNDMYSYQAQLRQMKEAGLSPSLFYGGGGGQAGATGAQGHGTQGMQTPYFPISMMEAAQIANINAQTEKTKAETDVVKPLAKADIAEKLASAGALEASKIATKWQAEINRLNAYVLDKSKESSIYYIAEQANYMASLAEEMYHKARSAKVLADVDEATFDTQVQQRIEDLNDTIQRIATNKSEEKLNIQRAKDLRDQILARIEQTRQEWAKIEIEREKVEIEGKKVDSYVDYINAVLPTIEKQIEIKLKELGIERWKVATGAICDIIKSVAIGAHAAATMAGKGGTPTPAGNPVTNPPVPMN